MESLGLTSFREVFRNRRVAVTGLTGFKGAWLGLWLHELGAETAGLSLRPETKPSLFDQARVGRLCESFLGDIRNPGTVRTFFRRFRPEIVFHMAAQSLVLRSYDQPLETFAVNVQGTLNVLDAARRTPATRVVVVATSDKCYLHKALRGRTAFQEDDPLGGTDPYSASKAGAEIAVAAYRRSFCSGGKPSISSVRAGNVIGGGDWAENRIIPDCVRALAGNKPVQVRNPLHTRPWQHVLEPLSGYLWLAAKQWRDPDRWAEPWNFGPPTNRVASVAEVVERTIALWGKGRWSRSGPRNGTREAAFLRIDSSKARGRLGWRPTYDLDQALEETIGWYRNVLSEPSSAQALCRAQIRSYTEAAVNKGLPWARTSRRS